MRWLRLLFHATGGGVSLVLSVASAVLLLGVGAVVLWAGSEGSLAQALQWAKPLLPAGQSLQVSEVTGIAQNGGRVGHLVWKQGQRTVEARNLQLAWDWHALLGGELRLSQVQADVLHVQDRTPSSGGPIAEVVLPLHVDAQLNIGTLQWAGSTALELQAVKGHYRYDGTTHHLDAGQLHMASGTYQVQGQLQARLPGALQVRAQGVVQAQLPTHARATPLDASATLEGPLYGPDAALNLQVQLQPQAGAKANALGAMRAQVQAVLHPARLQPIDRAQAEWSALDLASLWPQAPQTLLSGQAQVQPDDQGWRADVQVQNRLEGPVSQSRLPLQNASARVLHRGGQWLLQDLQAAVAGGSVTAQGSYGGATSAWSAQGRVSGIEPGRIDPRWVSAPLDGVLSAQQSTQGLAFEALLQTAAAKGTQAGSLAGTQLQAKGVWRAPALSLDSLLLKTPEAQIAGQVQWDSQTSAVRADLRASLPGAEGSVLGNAGPAQGQGKSAWRVSDAAAMVQWLSKLPVVGRQVQALELQGAAGLALAWDGGWQNQGKDMALDATVVSKRLVVQGVVMSDLDLQAKGTLPALALQARSKLEAGEAVVALQLQSDLLGVLEPQWKVRISSLQASVVDGLQPVPWVLQLQQALELDGQRTELAQAVRVSAGTLRLNGPAPGVAQLTWEPVQWASQAGGTARSTARWNSRGQLQGVPLAWLEVLGQTKLANMGLRGDLLFGGQWDARGGDGLQLRARVQHTSGDLQIQSTDANGGTLPAGLREAYVDLQVDRQAVQAKLVWASEAGGSAQADFSSRLEGPGSASVWAADAPVQGQVRASLPRMGAWSLFAPVGWRINGTLDADATLSGTRAKPVWKGALDARDLSIRSVVDGIDLSQGVMRLALDGQHMEVVEFTVRGAGGSGGGTVQVTGSVDWLPAVKGGPGGLANRLKMALDAKAQGFRATARPDQRLVVSGTLSARLQDAKLTLRGALVADQALIVLPDDTVPRLGSDVQIVRRSAAPKAPAAAKKSGNGTATTVVPDLLITLDPGPNFQLRGQGIDTRLAGVLTLKTQGDDPTPLLTGELRTVNGSYRAYGQNLSVEDGRLLFFGPFDNPVLNIRAVRPNLPQVVGVQINGTAQVPVVRLFAEPEMSEVEKLSWLALGRTSADGGAETALLQQAALALFAGKGSTGRDSLASAFGLDEVSLGRTSTTNLDGTTGTEATVKFGKRLSRDFYVVYERSLAGTVGTLYVFYDLSRRFTLRGEAGTTQAVDLIFTTRYD
jgi:translocation and assembly module TamB